MPYPTDLAAALTMMLRHPLRLQPIAQSKQERCVHAVLPKLLARPSVLQPLAGSPSQASWHVQTGAPRMQHLSSCLLVQRSPLRQRRSRSSLNSDPRPRTGNQRCSQGLPGRTQSRARRHQGEDGLNGGHDSTSRFIFPGRPQGRTITQRSTLPAVAFEAIERLAFLLHGQPAQRSPEMQGERLRSNLRNSEPGRPSRCGPVPGERAVSILLGAPPAPGSPARQWRTASAIRM